MNPPTSSTDKNAATRRRRETQRPDGDGWRGRLYDIIFEADTRAGWFFDVSLLIAILVSIAIIALETVPSYGENESYKSLFLAAEWILTILFTVEYVMRLCCVRSPLRYAISFWGIIDLLSILPTYVALFATSGTVRSFVMLRSVRLLRAFRVLKLWRMMNDADELSEAIWNARNKIIVFLAVVMVAITISGTMMYYIENVVEEIRWDSQYGEEFGELSDRDLVLADVPLRPTSRFSSIPVSMYWATVTMTTVGYGDITPTTPLGKIISAILILLGYSLIIVPSGFVSAELVSTDRGGDPDAEAPCGQCDAQGQRADAVYCYRCGQRLDGGAR